MKKTEDIVKYLYSYQQGTDELYKYKVTRETESNIWVLNLRGTVEIKVFKNKNSAGEMVGLSIGKNWDTQNFYQEDDEIKEKYRISRMLRDFLRKLVALKSCKDESIIIQIMNIKFPENNKEDEK